MPRTVLDHQLVTLPVSVLGQPENLTINGRLCLPKGQQPKAVLLALHGVTYTSQYWDAGYQPDTYSFVRKAMSAGYAVYAIDQIGSGLSYHPPGALVTLDAQTEVVHNLIGQLRAGKIGGRTYPYVGLVGHSYGSITAWLESSEYNDANILIATGLNSDVQPIPLVRFFSGFIPAPLDAKSAPQVGLDATYLTGGPGSRAQNVLYDLSNADPKMIDYDYRVLRSTITVGQGATFYNRLNFASVGQYLPLTSQEIKLPLPLGITKGIHIPSFLDNGDKDLLFCGADGVDCTSSQALQQRKAADFAPDACERAAVTPHASHDLNLQQNAPFTYQTVLTWADQALGPDGGKYAGYKAKCQSFSGKHGTGGPASFGALPMKG